MYESKREPGKKFMNTYVGRRFDSYSAGEQPGESNENEHAEPKDAGSSEADVKAHSPATSFHFIHDHENHKHTMTATKEDGSTETTEHNSPQEAHDSAAKLALEEGGADQASNVKKRAHYPQQGAESEDRNFEMPDLV